LAGTGVLTSITGTLGGLFVPVATTCPTTYSTTTVGAVNATSTKVDDNTATISVPSALTLSGAGQSKPYNVCIYAGTPANSSAIAGHGTFTLTPTATFTPSRAPAAAATSSR
jgi:hypothetical protein